MGRSSTRRSRSRRADDIADMETLTPDAPPTMPGRGELEWRARWFATLSAADLEMLPDLSMRDIEARYDAWRARQQRSVA